MEGEEKEEWRMTLENEPKGGFYKENVCMSDVVKSQVKRS